MGSFIDRLMEAIVGKKRFDLHTQRMIDREFVEQMKTKLQSKSCEERSIGKVGLALRSCSLSPAKKTPLVRWSKKSKRSRTKLASTRGLKPPPPSPSSHMLPSSIPPQGVLSPLDTSSIPPAIPSPLAGVFPPISDDMIGYGRYRHYKHAPREAILAHIDSQIEAISDVLRHFNVPESKIPGYDDITFGDRLRAKRAREMERIRAAAEPSCEVTAEGTTIQRGFPGRSGLINPDPDKFMGPPRCRINGRIQSAFNYRSDPIPSPPNKANNAAAAPVPAWHHKIGFTRHPIDPSKAPVGRKWSDLETLKPKWGPRFELHKTAKKLPRRVNGN